MTSLHCFRLHTCHVFSFNSLNLARTTFTLEEVEVIIKNLSKITESQKHNPAIHRAQNISSDRAGDNQTASGGCQVAVPRGHPCY